jgi:hypothetical protein
MDMVHYLGYIIDQDCVHVDIAKIQVIHDFPSPTTLTELLGPCHFLLQVRVWFSHIAWVLSQVTQGGRKDKFVWGQSQQQEFNDLK